VLETLKVIEEIEPEIIIHAAGNKDVRYCERHPTEAFRVNAIGTRYVAMAARNVGANCSTYPLILFSQHEGRLLGS